MIGVHEVMVSNTGGELGSKPFQLSMMHSRNELREKLSKILHESDNQKANNKIIEEMSPTNKQGFRTERKNNGAKIDQVRM